MTTILECLGAFIGRPVLVTSTRRDQHGHGNLRIVDEIGVAIALSAQKVRFYPWAQIAHVELDFDGPRVP